MGSLRPVLIAFVAAVLLAGPAVAAAAQPDRPLDVRDQLRTAAAAAPPPSVRRAERRAAALADATGGPTRVQVDPLTETVDRLQRLDGALSRPSGAPPAAVARGFVADHATALGLGADTAAGLTVERQVRSPTGLTVVTLGQDVDGVPLFDGGMRVGVDRAGRVLTLAGAPHDDLPADLPPATLTAEQAIGRVVPGATPASDDLRRLVVFSARSPRLAWHVTHRQDSRHWWEAVVDARTGRLLYRVNLVKSVSADVFENYPGYAPPVTRSLDAYLDPGATAMVGPYAHAYADLDDSDKVGAGEDTTPPSAPGDYPLVTNPGASCDAEHLCSWDGTAGTATQNKDQSVVQTFWYVNNFHDHLAAPPIGFTRAQGNFEGISDRVIVNALDGAATGPDTDHLNNANMATPPDGQNPWMQMYLFAPVPQKDFRHVNGGDDAAVVYHEYTHGLTSRLVTYTGGSGALNSDQSGAMGEAFSDFYAMDYLADQGFVTDSVAPGEVYLGRYTDPQVGLIRFQALDCPVDTNDNANCKNTATGSAGGFTYADFGRIWTGPEVHADGEIWAQTLWQLRQALISRLGAATGSDAAQALVTDALRLSPPEPTFLDLRNAILAADLNANGGANRTLIWSVFAQRGMGYLAATTTSSDVNPVADFQTAPAADAPRGTIAGTVTDARTGLPVATPHVSVAGLSSQIGSEDRLTTDGGSDGRYTLADVPAATYPRLGVSAPGYSGRTISVTVPGGGTAAGDTVLNRDWAAAAGGAQIAPGSDSSYAGCGADEAIDGRADSGWSEDWDGSHTPSLTVVLPTTITLTGLGLDPSAACGDPHTAGVKDYKIETSPDNATFTTVATGSLTLAQHGHINPVGVGSPRADVRYVRITLLAPLDPRSDYIDLSELEVYGNAPNALPTGALTVSNGAPLVGDAVTFDASSFRDPDSLIAGYRWDFDGDGAVDASTAGPSAAHAYATAGQRVARVYVDDVAGGSATAAAWLTVQAPPGPPPPPPLPPQPPLPPLVAKHKPSLTVPRTNRRWRIRVKVRCRDACRLGGRLTISTRQRRQLRLPRRTVATLKTRTVKGTRRVTLTLTTRTRRALHRAHRGRLTVTLSLTARVPAGPTVTVRRHVGIRR